MRNTTSSNPLECCLEMCCQILVYPLLDAVLNSCADQCQKCCDSCCDSNNANKDDEYSLVNASTAPNSPAMNRNSLLNLPDSSNGKSVVATTKETLQPH